VPITNPFAITYKGREVGGSTDYQLLGPYVIEKSYQTLRLVFDVVVVGTSYADLQAKSDVLETAFRRRLSAGETLLIDIGGTVWTYTMGSTLLKAAASITKTGNQETDRGYSRSYTCTIEAELPANDDGGLRDVEVLVDYSASRQRTVTMRGVYTATSAGHAVARYQAAFPGEASAYLSMIDVDAAWELVDENYSLDRERASGGSTPSPHLCAFTRQYVELLAEQSQGTTDDAQIRDHRVTFTDLSQHPGDSQENIHRLRRVVGTYECGVNIEQTTDLQSVFRDKILEHVKELFRDTFDPQVFGIEEQRVSYDETTKRLSASLQFVYQKSGGSPVVEASYATAYREARTIDYTPTHVRDELAAYVDVGWAVVERVQTMTAIIIGESGPVLRIANSSVQPEGWNLVANTSQATPQWIGDPESGEQVRVTILTETIVSRFSRKPTAGGTVVGIPGSGPGGSAGGGSQPGGGSGGSGGSRYTIGDPYWWWHNTISGSGHRGG